MSTTTSTRTCSYQWHHESGEYSGVCYLPAGHAGDHDIVDTMGICMENDDCRARRATEAPTRWNRHPIDWSDSCTVEEAAIAHNHPVTATDDELLAGLELAIEAGTMVRFN